MICPSIHSVSSTEFTYASTRMRTRVHCRCSSTSKMTSLITSYNTKLRSARRGRGICDDLSYMIGKTWSVAVTSSSSHVFPYSYLFILGCTYNFVLVCVRVCVCVCFSQRQKERDVPNGHPAVRCLLGETCIRPRAGCASSRVHGCCTTLEDVEF